MTSVAMSLTRASASAKLAEDRQRQAHAESVRAQAVTELLREALPTEDPTKPDMSRIIGDGLNRLYFRLETNAFADQPDLDQSLRRLWGSAPPTEIGKTIPEITDALAESYKRELKNPRLAVILRSFAPTRIYVSGEVTNPGEFVTVGPTLTVLQAIARAGGLKASAQSDKIMVLRRGAGEKSDVFAVDAASAASGARPDADVRLAPFDIVWVPKTGVAEVYTAFQQYIQQFLPLSGTLFYQVHGGGALIR